jgi:hypothetical protein
MSSSSVSSASKLPTVCNISRLSTWNEMTYTGPLAHVSTFWMYQTQPQIVLTQRLAMQKAFEYCKESFQSLYDYRAGRTGPIDIQHAFKVMCNANCLESDSLHQSAMRWTGCSCLQLSTQPGQALYKQPGDFCSKNSARVLCDMIGYCGIWNCRISDFMCPRYEFNKKIIPLKSRLGSCQKSDAGTRKYPRISFMMIVTILAMSIATLIFTPVG